MLSVYDDYKVLCVRLASREVLMGFCKELEDGISRNYRIQIMITGSRWADASKLLWIYMQKIMSS